MVSAKPLCLNDLLQDLRKAGADWDVSLRHKLNNAVKSRIHEYAQLFIDTFPIQISIARRVRCKEDIIRDILQAFSSHLGQICYPRALFQLICSQIAGTIDKSERLQLLQGLTAQWPIHADEAHDTRASIAGALTAGCVLLQRVKEGKCTTRAQFMQRLLKVCDIYNQPSRYKGFSEMAASCDSLMDIFNWYKHADKPVTVHDLEAALNAIPAAEMHHIANVLSVSSGTQHRVCQVLLNAFSTFQVWLSHDVLLADATVAMQILCSAKKRTRFGIMAACELRSLFRKYGIDMLRSPPSCKWNELFEDVDVSHAMSLLFKAMPKSAAGCPHDPVIVLTLRDSSRSITNDVISLRDDCMSLLMNAGIQRLPKSSESPDIHKRIAAYQRSGTKMRKRIAKYYDLSNANACNMTVPTNVLCLESPWRSAQEQQLMETIPGWPQQCKAKQFFLDPSIMARDASQTLHDCFSICHNINMSCLSKIQQCASILCCEPLPAVIERAMACEARRKFSDLPLPSCEFPCRACPQDFETRAELQSHIAQHHCDAMFSEDRAFAEYRKHVLHISKCAGPCAIPWETQRRCGENFMAKTLHASNANDFPKSEQACVVCSRLMWSDKLSNVKFFACRKSEEEHEAAFDVDITSDEETCDQRDILFTQEQQERIFNLLSVENYGKRWPHIWKSDIGRRELLSSSVQCPNSGARLLLHQRRVPGAVHLDTHAFVADANERVRWCPDCRGSLHRKIPQMPKYALANDNWGGRILPQLLNLAPGTIKLLPRVRVYVDVTVLGPKHMPKDLKQTGLIGNHIIVPQASPTQVLKTLPPSSSGPDALADFIAFVAVATSTSNFHKARLWSAPRIQYERAVMTLKETSLGYKTVVLDQEELLLLPENEEPALQLLNVTQSISVDDPLCSTLNQLGPADANEASTTADDSDHENVSPQQHHTDKMEQPGSSAALIGGSELADDNLAWLCLRQQIDELCEPSIRHGPETFSAAEEYFRLQKANDADADALQGRDKSHVIQTEKRIHTLQHMAAKAGRTKWDGKQELALLGKSVDALVVPGGGELVSMFDPMTFALAMPECFAYGDAVPFLKRVHKCSYLEWLQMMLVREELCYQCSTDEITYTCETRNRWSDSESFTAVAYDMWRRLQLISATKAHVQRPGFHKSCTLIAELSSQHLLEAIAMLGKKADVRSMIRNKDINPRVKEALQALVLCTARVLGTEGHRTALRHKSVAAGLHHCAASLFVTPNLADTRASLIVTLSKGPDATQHEAELLLWQEDPEMPSLVQMMRLISKDAVAQAKFFDLMINAMFTELFGTSPPMVKEYIPSYATAAFEDDWASSCEGGVFGDIAAATGPVETQGRGSLHPHILIWLPNFSMFDAFADMLQRATAGQLHAELETWSQCVLNAASHMQYSCQELFSEQMQMIPRPLPFLSSHLKKSGPDYEHVALAPEEKDGHIVRAAALGLPTTGEISLRGAFASTSPIYLRRQTKASVSSYKTAITADYRRGIILNHFHKCTKSCFKKAFKETALTICRFGCQHAQMVSFLSEGKLVSKKCLFRGWPAVSFPHFQHIPDGDDAAQCIRERQVPDSSQTSIRRHVLSNSSGMYAMQR